MAVGTATRYDNMAWGRGTCRKAVPTRTCSILIIVVLLQFLLTFAQGQGQGEAAVPPVDERVEFTIEEELPSGTLVGTIPTRDGLTYRFSEEPNLFALDGTSGHITTTMRIDRESLPSDSFDLFIQSVPTARHLIEVHIEVLDINDNVPEFGRTTIQIIFSETDQPATQKLLDTAMDGDIGENDVTADYEIISGNEAGLFELVPLTDTSIPLLYLQNKVQLDREEKDNYQLVISARDGGTPPKFGFLTVNINITDINDNPPLFDQSDYSATVNETIPIHTSIIQVHATDRDIGRNADIRYSIVNDDYNQFDIDERTGIVRTLRRLYCKQSCSNEEQGASTCHPSSCVVVVEASDDGHPQPQTGRAYITVSLIDENDHAPVIIIGYTASSAPYATVDEGANLGHVAAIVSVTDLDEDENGATTLSVIKGNEEGHFTLDTTTGINMIRVAGQLDRERVNKYNLTLRAVDHGEPQRSSTAFLIIMVNDINDHRPVFQEASYSAILGELTPVGSFVASITATDNDTGINAQVSYAIMTGDEQGWFQINQNTGLLTTNAVLDHEVLTNLVLRVQAQDGAASPYSSYTNVTITILDENDMVPTFAQSVFELSLPEGTAAGSTVITTTAIDNDQGLNGTVRYAFDPEVDAKYPGMFQLNSITGRIVTQHELDREVYRNFHLKVKATDQGTPPLSSTATVNIHVLDLNDNDPVFYPLYYYASVLENQPGFTSVVQVTATDRDFGDNAIIHFSITSGANEKFVIDITSGWITTVEQLDREERDSYTLTIRAQDMGGRLAATPAIVQITVNDLQDSLPTFTSTQGYTFSIAEDDSRVTAQVGRLVGQVRATTQDTSSDITYEITAGDPNGLFTINRNGVISSGQVVDREQGPFYSLTIVARAGSLFRETLANISILDVNDNPPSFPAASAESFVVENWPVGHDVFLAEAYDPDHGNNATLTYTITYSSSNMFTIDSDTGLLHLARAIQPGGDTQFALTVQAADGGTPSQTATMDITISVTDYNDNTPQFEQTAYEVSILESQPVNNRFYQVTATDRDTGVNGEVLYSIESGNEGEKFGIFPDGVLYIAHELDRETKDLYILTIKAVDMAVEPRSSEANITIHILDANDNRPVFSNHTYEFYIPENSEIDTFVGFVSASDIDLAQNGEIIYRIEGDDTGFDIHPTSGAIVTMKSFDREALIVDSGLDAISLVVIASDSGATRLTDRAVVNVHVRDMNDNAPEFVSETYDPSLYENAEVNTQVVKVSATDSDVGINGQMTYSIANGNVGNVFSIDELTGQITLIGTLDRETSASYVLDVTASDAGTPPMSTTVQVYVTILDNNDNAPVFAVPSLTADVIETSLPQTYITQVTAADADVGNNAFITYSIATGNDRSMFHIEGSTGKLYLANTLDYEWKQQFRLTITATDFGSPVLSSTSTCIINVLDFNDNEPYFSSSPMVRQIDEGADIGTSILTITASDPDSGINGQLEYQIVNQVPSGNLFTIDSSSGLITTAAEIDREFADNFQITVRATDLALPASARKSAEKIVTVMVLDVNDNSPHFTSMNAVPVLQTVSPNTRLTTVQATDADDGNNGRVQYSISSGDTSRFRIDAHTGSLILTSSLSSQIQTYDLNIEARDMASTNQRSTTSLLTVFLRASIENGPSFTQASYSGEVYENKPAGTSILTVSAHSSNGAGNSVEYYITGITADGLPQPRYFQVHPTSGVLSTWEELDREQGASVFRVEVYTVDTSATAPLTRTTQVTITLLDRNDSPPEFSAGMFNEVEVPENTNPGHVLMQIIATDADEEGTVTYAITSGNEAGRFAIDPVQGELQIIQPLDREEQAFYDLEITASDGSQSSSKVIKVIVTDINDQEPLFTQPWYYFDIGEDSIMGTTIGQVVAIDADSTENGGVRYSVISHWGREMFTLSPSSGVFTLAAAIDFEQTQHYILTIQAEDSGFQPLSSTVTVYMNVIDVNDNAPEFDPGSYSNEVWENATIGTSILIVTATDIDAGLNAEVRYSITGGDPNGRFTVNELTGEVHTAKLLDREQQGFYNLVITARDQAMPESAWLESTAMVSIILEDNNDNPPLFTSPSKVVVRENAGSGTSVFQVQAEDLDEGRNGYIEYQLHPADTAMFSIGPVDGIVRIRSASLDRESSDTYELRVVATDKGVPPQSSTMTLTIIVGDVNDNNPVFNPRTYDATLPESVVIGTYVLTVTATDRDISINADIRYLITSGNDNQDFRLDSHTGELYIHNGLDYERNHEYSITVTVQDLGEPHLSDTATVHITVTDLNDNAPVFLDAPYIAYVQENTPPSPVMTISAVDYDSSSFANTKYSIVDGDSTFEIDQNTGVITSTRQLDREERSQYELHVKAMDGTSSRLSSTARITVLVQDENDNTPHFIRPNSLSIASVLEDAPPSTLIFQAYATDEDTGNNAQIRYHLEQSSNGKFAIHPTTGAITTTTTLDREQQETHNLVVKATDGGLLAKYATVPLVVVVEDINDNQPIFPLPKYTTYIRDPTSAGDYVLGVTALDADVGTNGEIGYSIFGGGETDFQIDADTGVITARRTITNIQSRYTFYVRATDKGTNLLSNEATIEVHVLPPGTTNFPTFVPSPQQFTLQETEPIGNTLTTVSATTPRQGRAISYHMAGGNVGQTFAISQSSGVITINKPLDFETTTSYQLWLEARDNSNPQLSEYLRLDVTVQDRNDNAPVFSSTLYNVTVTEEEHPPISVLIVAATDADSGDNGRVTYAITGGNEGTPFLIDASAGQIRTNMKLDRETQDHYLLQVEAIDHGQPSRTATAVVDVRVLDKNDEPPIFTQHFHTHITENAPIGTFVLKITSTDKDIEDNSIHTYAFTENPDSKFTINSLTGEIVVAGELDYEQKDEYILWVSANDQAYNTRTTVSIYIDDANDNAPIFSAQSYSFSVLEQQPVDSSVGQITATDRDSEGRNSQVFYVFKTSTSWFHLDSESGEVFNRDILMYLTAGNGPSPENIHHLVVQAIDRGSPVMSSEVAVTITIEPANQDAIYFVEDSYWAPIAEDVSTGTSVVQVEASVVGNPSAAVSYSENGGNGTSFFLLNENTGLISVAQSLSGQSGKVFTFVVRAQQYNSISGMSASITVVIQVAEVNRFSPRFVTIGASYQTTVAENRVVGTIIASVNATDADSGSNGQVSFFLVEGDEQGLFSIEESQGYIRIAQPLDYELTTSHRLTIAARDQGLIPRETREIFTVYVTDVNDNSPLFAAQHLDAHFMENSPSGSTVYQAVAVDADSSPNNQVVYSMTGPTATVSKFLMDAASGVISSQGQIDYEQVQEYQVLLTAMNPGTTLSSTATLTIHIEGRNEFVPHFSQASYQFAVSESDTTGFSIGSVLATDMDHGEDGAVYYYLIGDSNVQGFSMDVHTGALRVDSQVDRESSSEIILDVLAKNSGPIRGNDTSRCTVTVLVRDANDPPYFSATVYEGHVLEDAPLGTSIIQVSALDSDLEDEFRSFTYSLQSGNDVDAFGIDPTSGLITKQGALDRESSPTLNLTVAAIDSGVPPQTGTTLVRVFVDDVNDNGPYFEPALPTAPFTENTEPDMQTIFNLVPFIHDHDLPPNQGPYTYRLLNHSSDFAIGLTSGLLKPKIPLDRETQAEYFLRMEVSDNGSPTVSSTLVMKVEVEDMNDNPSTQRPMTVEVYVFEGRLPGATIANVRPLDPDLIGTYQCQLVAGDRTMFSISSGCDLKTGFLYNEQRYDLTVSGSDGIHQNVDSAVTVQFHSFDQAMADHSIQVKISVNSVSEFLQHYYTSFVDAVQQFIPTGYSLVLYAMSQTSPHVSVFMAAPGSSSGQFMSQNALMLNLQSNRATIEDAADLTLASINYNPCQVNPCQNDAECSSAFRAYEDDVSVVDSPSLVFAGARVEQVVECQCPEEFTGAHCEIPISNCNADPCQHGGTCVLQSEGASACQCPSNWSGDRCEEDVNECLAFPCRNGGTCLNRFGSYECDCTPQFTGDNCERGVNFCESSPCGHGGTCSPQQSGFTCACPFGTYGLTCQTQSAGFAPLSFMTFDTLWLQQNNTIIIEFTTNSDGLLLFSGKASEFVAIEVVNSNVRFGFSLGEVMRRLTVGRVVTDGTWYRVVATRNLREASLRVYSCPEGQTQCDACSTGSSNNCFAYDNAAQPSQHELLNLGHTLVNIAGVENFLTIENNMHRLSTHDFVGCIRRVQLDGADLLSTSPSASQGVTESCPRMSTTSLCTDDTCSNGGSCIDQWDSFLCLCPQGFSGTTCEEEATPFVFGANALVTYEPRESYIRDQMLAQGTGRRKRQTQTSSRVIQMSIRATKDDALLFYSKAALEYTALQLRSGMLEYVSRVQGESQLFRFLLEDQTVNDGQWHDVILTVSGKAVSIDIDGSYDTESFEINLPDPLDLSITAMYLGGSEEDVTLGGQSPVPGFEGCMENFAIDGDALPFDGSTERFEAVAVGGSEEACAAFLGVAGTEEGPGGMPVAVIVVIVVFFILLVVGILVGLGVRYRRKWTGPKVVKGSNGMLAPKNNGTMHDKTPDSRSHQDSGYTENGDVPEELIIRQHIQDELATHAFNEREITDHRLPARPDIIAPEAAQVHMGQDANLLLDGSGGDNIGYIEEPPEHYDIDNASSIAPSDLVDVVGHYKRYRAGMMGQNKYKNTTNYLNNLHPHRYSPSPLQSQPLHESPHGAMRASPASMLSHRESPNIMAMQAMQSTALARQSPAPRIQPSPLTINNVNNLSRTSPMPHQARPLSPLNQLNRQSPAGMVAKRVSPLPIGSLRSTPVSGLYPSNASSSSYSERPNIPNGHMASRPNSRMKQPINQLAMRSTPTRGLTVEDVERLNARPKSTLPGTHDAFSSSSEAPSRNILARGNLPPPGSYDPTLEPPESSSDDGSNDSFTCSEFEYDNDKVRNDFQPNRLLFPKLPETENENEDTDASRTFTYDGSGSTRDRDSLSTFFNSDDELPKPSNKLLNGALNLDYFLSWGPNFEKLVGVFTDIAELPDADLKTQKRPSSTQPDIVAEETNAREEYV